MLLNIVNFRNNFCLEPSKPEAWDQQISSKLMEITTNLWYHFRLEPKICSLIEDCKVPHGGFVTYNNEQRKAVKALNLPRISDMFFVCAYDAPIKLSIFVDGFTKDSVTSACKQIQEGT